ncbi:MAG: hypothetical protein H6713_35925 [Myxococcales bacterium]|nr:hypothetical protein [Myxococcales bacterium]MCB9755361.1 hypothetical protein [Myxococcales bacterium]
MNRTRALLLLLTAALLLAVMVAGPRVRVHLLKRAITAAETVSQERDALCRANRWVHDGKTPTYSVHAEDLAGAEIKPHLDGRYDRVAAVTLRWTNGVSVRRELLGNDVLSCVYGE